MTELKAEKRDKKGKKVQELRNGGRIPAVVYGKKEESTPITLNLSEFEKAWNEAGESTVITLSGLGENKEVLIHEVSVHPVTGAPQHVDLYAIEKGKKVEVSVPLEFVGVSPAEKELGGTLVKVMYEIEIEAMPKDLPHAIEVDVTVIKDFDTQIQAKDITLPQGVTLITEPDEVIALASEAREEEEEPAEEAPDLSAIQVEKKGKEEESTEGETPKKEE